MSGAGVVIVAARDGKTRNQRRSALVAESFQFHEAESAVETLALAERHKPDVVLLDLDLADADGAGICARLKSDQAFSGAIVLWISDSATGDRKKAALLSPADAFLVEPVEPEAAAATARAMLRLSQARREQAMLAERVRTLEGNLREAQADVERFAAQTFHDVEEPLRSVSTFVQLIEERREGQLTDDERSYLGYVLASGTRVRHLLRSFLTYAQVGRGRRSEFGRVDLRIVAVSAIQALRKRVEETGTAIQIEGKLPPVLGDFGELQRVFELIIGNAIDYRRPGSSACVTVELRPSGNGESIIAIADNGNGVPEHLRTAVFEPFKRLHGREIPGAGMGLAIAKKIVEAHGGRIWVESAPGKGACFCFTLPALETAA